MGECGSARAAMIGIERSRPHVALLDVTLPDGSGIELCRTVHARHPSIACVILAPFHDDETLVTAVLAGATGYLHKDGCSRYLADSVRRAAAGENLIDQRVFEHARMRLDRSGRRDLRLDQLTKQETRVLALIAQGMTNQQIANEMGLTPKTVKNYVSNVLVKLGVERRNEAAAYARCHLPGAQVPVEPLDRA